ARAGVGGRALRDARPPAQAARGDRRRRAGGQRQQRLRTPPPPGPASPPAATRMSLHELTDEQRAIRDLARRFADEVVAPEAPEWDREHRFPRELVTRLGDLGLL